MYAGFDTGPAQSQPSSTDSGGEPQPSGTQEDTDETSEVKQEAGENVTFRSETKSIEECRTTCREVTVVLSNDRSADAHNVNVVTKMYSGGDIVWEGSKNIGTLKSGKSYTTTKEIDVGLGGGMKIQSNDGKVTDRDHDQLGREDRYFHRGEERSMMKEKDRSADTHEENMGRTRIEIT